MSKIQFTTNNDHGRKIQLMKKYYTESLSKEIELLMNWLQIALHVEPIL
jgi:hypothetical protein